MAKKEVNTLYEIKINFKKNNGIQRGKESTAGKNMLEVNSRNAITICENITFEIKNSENIKTFLNSF